MSLPLHSFSATEPSLSPTAASQPLISAQAKGKALPAGPSSTELMQKALIRFPVVLAPVCKKAKLQLNVKVRSASPHTLTHSHSPFCVCLFVLLHLKFQ
jgi:hypothetical protein